MPDAVSSPVANEDSGHGRNLETKVSFVALDAWSSMILSKLTGGCNGAVQGAGNLAAGNATRSDAILALLPLLSCGRSCENESVFYKRSGGTEEIEDCRRHQRHKLRIKLDRSRSVSFDRASLSRECARARWPFPHRQQNRINPDH